MIQNSCGERGAASRCAPASPVNGIQGCEWGRGHCVHNRTCMRSESQENTTWLEQISNPYKKTGDGHIPAGKYLSSTAVNITGSVEQAVNRMTTTGWTQSSRVGPGEATWEMVEKINEGLSKIPCWSINQHVTQKLELHKFIYVTSAVPMLPLRIVLKSVNNLQLFSDC